MSEVWSLTLTGNVQGGMSGSPHWPKCYSHTRVCEITRFSTRIMCSYFQIFQILLPGKPLPPHVCSHHHQRLHDSLFPAKVACVRPQAACGDFPPPRREIALMSCLLIRSKEKTQNICRSLLNTIIHFPWHILHGYKHIFAFVCSIIWFNSLFSAYKNNL